MVTLLAGRTTLASCFRMLKGYVKLVSDQNKLYRALVRKQNLIYSLISSFFPFFISFFFPELVLTYLGSFIWFTMQLHKYLQWCTAVGGMSSQVEAGLHLSEAMQASSDLEHLWNYWTKIFPL